jgi:hypothetical protein
MRKTSDPSVLDKLRAALVAPDWVQSEPIHIAVQHNGNIDACITTFQEIGDGVGIESHQHIAYTTDTEPVAFLADCTLITADDDEDVPDGGHIAFNLMLSLDDALLLAATYVSEGPQKSYVRLVDAHAAKAAGLR